MVVEITGRHVEITDSIREYAQGKMDKLLRDYPRVDNVHLILDVQKYLRIAELVVHARRHIRVEAKESTEDMNASIEAVVDKIEKQLAKSLSPMKEHKVRDPQKSGKGEEETLVAEDE